MYTITSQYKEWTLAALLLRLLYCQIKDKNKLDNQSVSLFVEKCVYYKSRGRTALLKYSTKVLWASSPRESGNKGDNRPPNICRCPQMDL